MIPTTKIPLHYSFRIYTIGVSLVVLLISTFLATQGNPSSAEVSLFHFFNNAPSVLVLVFEVITFAGSLYLAMLLWAAIAYAMAGRIASLAVVLAGLSASLSAQIIKRLIERPRPEAMLDNINLYGHQYSGWGFPSGHATFATACAITVMLYTPSRFRPWLLLVILFVGISRLYLGAHFPLDVIGGYALGAAIAVTVSYLFESLRYKALRR